MNTHIKLKIWDIVTSLLDYRRHPDIEDYNTDLKDLADEIVELAGRIEVDLDNKADYEREAKKGEL